MFSSKRERCMWGIVGVAIVTIFASLGFAHPVSNWLINRDLIDAVFGLGMLLVCGSILFVGLRTRPGKLEIGLMLGIVAIYLVTFARMAIPEERTHLIEYSVLALLLFEALTERMTNGRSVSPNPAVLAFLLSASIGVTDEIVQFFLPNRVFDYRDIVFNILATTMAIGGIVLLRQVSHWQARG